MKNLKKTIIEETESFTTIEEWIRYMQNILNETEDIENTPACYDPKPYLEKIEKVITIGKLATNIFKK